MRVLIKVGFSDSLLTRKYLDEEVKENMQEYKITLESIKDRVKNGRITVEEIEWLIAKAEENNKK
jgi:hypothetical protein